MYSGKSLLNVKEPVDPPLIERFLSKMKKNKSLELSRSDERREKAMLLAKKKFMASKLEDNLLEGKAKEFLKEKRLNLKRKRNL